MEWQISQIDCYILCYKNTKEPGMSFDNQLKHHFFHSFLLFRHIIFGKQIKFFSLFFGILIWLKVSHCTFLVTSHVTSIFVMFGRSNIGKQTKKAIFYSRCQSYKYMIDYTASIVWCFKTAPSPVTIQRSELNVQVCYKIVTSFSFWYFLWKKAGFFLSFWAF